MTDRLAEGERTVSDAERAMRRALDCLFIAVDASIAQDVKTKVLAGVQDALAAQYDAIRAAVEEMRGEAHHAGENWDSTLREAIRRIALHDPRTRTEGTGNG